MQLHHKKLNPLAPLILDCEGTFYLILIDPPEILDNIKTIIMVYNYINIHHKNYIDNILKQNIFHIDFLENWEGGHFIVILKYRLDKSMYFIVLYYIVQQDFSLIYFVFLKLGYYLHAPCPTHYDMYYIYRYHN